MQTELFIFKPSGHGVHMYMQQHPSVVSHGVILVGRSALSWSATHCSSPRSYIELLLDLHGGYAALSIAQ